MSGKTTHELVIDLINNNDTGLLDRMIELAEAGAYSKDSKVFSNPTRSLLKHLEIFEQHAILSKTYMGHYCEDMDMSYIAGITMSSAEGI